MKLSVVIVNYNVRYYLEQCIYSVLKATKSFKCEIVVVDNHSSDGSVEFLRNRFGDNITIVECIHNQGFAKANNLAIQRTTGEYVLLLNPDTFISEDSIINILDFMDANPKVGSAGAMMHNSNGTLARESRRALPTPFVSLLKMIGASRRYYMGKLPWDIPVQIEVVSGAFMMLRRSVLEITGLLDEDFFMYGEDIDMSYRIQKSGFENWYIPVSIVHYKGESTQKSSFRYVHVFYRAMLIFFRKHYGHLSFLITVPIKFAIYLRAFIALCQMQYWNLRKSLGFYDKRRNIPVYCFHGSEKMIQSCSEIARRKGLAVSNMKYDCIVYDTDLISFSDIIKESKQHKGVEIGTYSSKSGVILTHKEVIT